MTLGPLMIDLAAPALSPEERAWLAHPLIGGVILFTRNYSNPAQLLELTGAIHAARHPPLLIAVDHEGGRVQRFREGFTRLPACALLGKRYDADETTALQEATACGWVMAAELRAAGIDFSFAPVLDLNRGVSGVIGDRAFHADPNTVGALAYAFVKGMREAGMAAVGKHFPGHGAVAADSHHAVPVDERELERIFHSDLRPFQHLIQNNIEALMPAHVIYTRVDDNPAGFSRIWLQDILRRRLEFDGVIFSDDLNMAGAGVAGDITQRAVAALTAGCDMALICNNPAAIRQLLTELKIEMSPLSRARLMRMHGRAALSPPALQVSERWLQNTRLLASLMPAQMDLDDNAA
ncbi:MAG TPA: beta-N-acetylhexosaminidase [Gammaproteobacteria bacterium]|nr:beta-N-acetylhexosaminidase [Gammaproteobacteria bacterium]